MKKMMKGDTFYPATHPHNPYIVVGVMKDGYMVRQGDDDIEEYSIKVIHDLFTANENPWTLKRKKSPIFTSANDDLFRV